MNATPPPTTEEDGNHPAGQHQREDTFDDIIAQINNNADFAAVAQAILRTTCKRVKARSAVLLAMERETTPLLRASFKVEPPFQTGPSPSSNQASSSGAPVVSPTPASSALHRVAIRSAGHLVGLLELQRDSDTQLSASEQRELEVLASLAALLIRREHAAEVEAALDTKMGQFESHKEQFIHLVSHQLRTPLTSIKGFAQLLARQQRSGNPEVIGRYSNTILQETNRLNTMINNLMELSRMEVAMVGIRRIPFDLNEVVSHTLATASNEQQIKSSLAPNLPVCSGDPIVLAQALTVLIDHALHTTHQHISISTTQIDHHLNVELALAADDWPERQSDDMQSVSLSQAVDSSDKQNPAMSLYVVRNLTEAMGGDISLARSKAEVSDQNTALRYILSLPLASGGESLGIGTRLLSGKG